ncbi:MAG TPA: hypothetical protein VKE51_43020 [Vicinamibacterales bacterium]|nr:hypothetical protein [Vicinamibacterales bacterium]
MALLEQLGEIGHLVSVLRPNADEVLGDDSLTKQVVQGCLKICLLPQRIRTRSRQQLLRPEGRNVSGEPLKGVPVRALFRWRLRCTGAKQRRACDDTGVADEAGIPGDHVFDVARCPMTELTTPFRYEMLGQLHLPRERSALDSLGQALRVSADQRLTDSSRVRTANPHPASNEIAIRASITAGGDMNVRSAVLVRVKASRRPPW